MAKKAKQESQAEQSERFLALVQELVDAGDVDLAIADELFEATMTKISPPSKGAEHS